MNIQFYVKNMTPAAYQRLCYAVETGKWPEGDKLTEVERSQAMQVVLLYQAKFNAFPQHMTVGHDGELVIKSKQQLSEDFSAPTGIRIKTQQID